MYLLILLCVPIAAAPSQVTTPVANNSSENLSSDESNYITIDASMIGTFYRSSSPETPPFVNVGDSIKKGDTICIIEAMKLFNEIESEVSGTIKKILIEDSNPVEYGQAIISVEIND